MKWALEAYQRLLDAQRNRPKPEDEAALKVLAEREAINARIKRRLPKVI